MATAPTSSSISPTLQQFVQVRRAGDGALPIDGSDSDWTVDHNLVCESVRWQKGAKVGQARFTYQPTGKFDSSFEMMLGGYSTDDQVRVILLPYDDQLQSAPATAAGGKVIFEGVLMRHQFGAQKNQGADVESVSFTAFALPVLDNIHVRHIITGRWMADERELFVGSSSGIDPILIDSIDLPPVFNFRGRPNMHPTATIKASWGGGELTAPVFTHDDDPKGKHWTVQKALASVLVRWLYGAPSDTLPRHIDLDADLLRVLSDGNEYELTPGITRKLSETNVLGKGVIDAVDAILRTNGFDFAIEPVGMEFDYADRRYLLRAWANGKGRIAFFDLAKRGSTFASAEQAMARNNSATLSGMRDGHEVVNELIAKARLFIECRLKLKPLWASEDVDASPIDSLLQSNTKELLETGVYHTKHVGGGALYDQFGHVGRMWGLDCVGGFVGYGDEAALYKHDPSGFNFPIFLNLKNKDINKFLVNANLPEEGESVIDEFPVWSRRVRRALPLRNPQAQKLGLEYVLEYTVDGVNWAIYPGRFKTLREYFGIFLSIKNLAVIGADDLSGETPVPIAESFWQKIADHKLQFRLTCTIESDTAMTYHAIPKPQSASRYSKAKMRVEPVEELWVAPKSFFNDDDSTAGENSEWKKSPIFGVDENTEANTFGVLQYSTELKRDGLDDARLSAVMRTWLMDLDRYRLGDRIKSVRGRNYSFAGDAGTSDKFPSVSTITFNIGVKNQGIAVTLTDEVMIAGAGGSN